MISTNDFHTGLTIDLDDEIFTVVEFQHVKPGKGAAFVRTKLKNLRTGAVTERTFRAGEKVTRAHLERRSVEYLYRSSDTFYMMDLDSYEQTALSKEQMEEVGPYLKENEQLSLIVYHNQVVGVEMPKTVELLVTETDPGVKGDTVSGGSKPATLETGLVVNVPFFINVGDRLRIDTRSGAYVERV